MLRRTKIVATLGPATDSPEALDKLIEAGIDVVRLNFSHGSEEEHLNRAETVRNRARAHGRQVGVMADLQGPKIRIGKFVGGKIQLAEGDAFCIDMGMEIDAGTQEAVGTTYKELHNDLSRGDSLLLDDGRIVLWVRDVDGNKVNCRVTVGGALSNNKGINLQGGGLSAAALTDKDRADILIAAKMQADYVAVSFVRSAEDVREARKLLIDAGWGECGIVSKMERAEAIPVADEIIAESDGIMVARGDLGVEIGDASLPPVQKRLIKLARSMDRFAITATQMMESMIENPIPTRAEVFDVANAVLDGTDAVMLSGETAVGKYPEKVVEAMSNICIEAEQQRAAKVSGHRMNEHFRRRDEAIAMAAMYTANHLGVKAIASLTESGHTALWMSRISSGIPIFAMTRNLQTRRKVTMYRGVYPVSFDLTDKSKGEINQEMIDELVRRGVVRTKDTVILTKGDLVGEGGGTNTMKICRVGSMSADDLDAESS
ncbi:MAG: pyruvate kinase [Gammaproteobacteria bacterium]|jgi:pyruvate kinase|nr:pyruvate kinase [Gammaproteobacteria bacterium]MBT4607506.1 pyruvate kinase [Thiotrichales bacterium]MBT3472179.1 pyruvate kinase [Gammaproteobacteria bacterium]MBT3967302.1 pyruvate kinase [Gammaproteobacteria bacterium]MBT4082120.1 pyruvate kinase [Gammaproteobacteria bacterium]